MSVPATVIDPKDLKKVTDKYPIVANLAGDEHDLAALTDLDISLVRQVVQQYPEVLDAALRKFESEGKAAEVIARKAQAELVRRIADVSSTANPLEAIDYLKPITRILENADRVRLAERETDKYANLPVIHFTIGTGGAITTTVEQVEPVVDVVSAAEVDEEVQSSTAPEAGELGAAKAALALAFDAVPLPLGEDVP